MIKASNDAIKRIVRMEALRYMREEVAMSDIANTLSDRIEEYADDNELSQRVKDAIMEDAEEALEETIDEINDKLDEMMTEEDEDVL